MSRRATSHRSRRRSSEVGFGLVELLTAAAIAAVLLASGWAWLWSMAHMVRCADDRAQALTAAASAMREVGDDIEAAQAVLPPAPGTPADSCIQLACRSVDGLHRQILIVWDPSRAVLWRATSSTYLADHVSRFVVTYLNALGERVPAADGGGPPAGAAGVRVCLQVVLPGGAATLERDYALPGYRP